MYLNKKNSHKMKVPTKEEEISDTGSSVTSLESDLKERETWTGRLDFLLSCIGFAVGLGNIWRFPYLCYKSGGGAFLIPYAIFLLLCGLPLFFLEVSYGQFASLSPITVWKLSPLFKGIGYGMVIISGMVCIYYNIIITWTFYYLFKSMQKVLPWSLCGQNWNTEWCVEEGVSDGNSTMLGANSTMLGANGTAETTTATMLNGTFLNASGLVTNVSALAAAANDSRSKTSSEEFWSHNVLEITDGLENFGEIRWPLFGCLVLAWTVVFLCLCKGVKSSGRVVYVSATFPYVVLFILLIRGVTLPGAAEGIKFYLIPQWDMLLSFKVWGDAAVQIFYSVGMAWGSLITMSSYNKFHNNIYKDAMIVPLLNCGTSIFAGFVIFSVLGFMSHTTGEPIDKVASGGPGLIFVVYPQAVAMMPLPQLWAILFFLMIFTIGLDSQFGMFETMTSAFVDEFPHVLRKRKVLFTLIMCLIEFVLGVPMIFQGGIYLLTLMDWYASCFSLMLLSFLECAIISWVYGVDRFLKDIELMIGFKPHTYWKYMWKYTTPAVVLFIWIFSISQLEPVTYGKYNYPDWAIVFGWCFALCSIIPLPIIALVGIKNEKGTLYQRIKKLIQHDATWGPAKPQDRDDWIATLTGPDLERFEAAQENLDVSRYRELKSRKSNSIYKGPVTTIAIDSTDDQANANAHMLPSGASNYSQDSSSHFTSLLNGEKPPNSVC